MPRLILEQLTCDSTTEHGADEIYILIAGTYNGPHGTQKFNKRLPSDGGHWDMNDGSGDANHILRNVPLLDVQGSGFPGFDVNLVVIVMEEDGGSSLPYQNMIAELLQEFDDPTLATAGQILSLLTKWGLYLKDTDDYIGAFTVSFGMGCHGDSCRGYSEFKAKDRFTVDQPGPGGWEIRLNGDGSNYDLILSTSAVAELEGWVMKELGSRPFELQIVNRGQISKP